jgi:hypothetical protein
MARNFVNLAEIMGQVDNSRANESNLKRQQQLMQMQDYDYQRQLKQDQEQEALKSVYSGAIDTTGEAPKLNEQKLIQDLMQRGYGEQALKLQDQIKERELRADKLQNETKSSSLKYQMDLTDYSYNVMAGASPQDWLARKQDLISKGVKAAESMPDDFDPNFQRNFLMDAKTFRESQKPKEYGTTINYDQQNRGFVLDKSGNPKYLDGVQKAPEKIDYNKAFLPDGSPNKAYQDYEANKKPNKAGLSATAQKELFEADETIEGSKSAIESFKQALAINDKAMGGFGSGTLATVGSVLPEAIRPDAVDATKELDNILQNAALPQLKAIFGGMPTEGERAILLEVQGSSAQPSNVRTGIFNRAIKAAEKRIAINEDKASRLRSGTYFSDDAGTLSTPTPQAAKPASPKLKIGTIEDGYVYRGGDPANPSSWKKSK